MNSIRFFLPFLLILGSFALAKAKLNIVLIYADDMGIDSVRAFNENLGLKTPKVVEQLTAVFRKFVKNGRSTPGPKQVNHHGIHWEVIPWDKGK